MVYNIINVIIMFQARKTELNLILINLIVSDLLITIIGVPLDLIGTVTHGKALNDVVCPITAFTHTFLGNRWNTFSYVGFY